MIDQIKNIRFIYQSKSATNCPSDPIRGVFGAAGMSQWQRFAAFARCGRPGNKAMTTLSTSSLPVPLTRAFAALALAAGRLGRRVVAAWRHRNDVAMLASFDERMLRDIGLTRSDLNDALSEPMWRDPTAVLVRRQRERRATRVTNKVIDRLPGRAAPSIVPLADTLAVAR
jgi:uncharacterized protein YjiS (DUF1127 family)